MADVAVTTRGTPSAGGADRGRQLARRARDVTVTVLAVATSLFSSLMYFVLDISIPGSVESDVSVRAGVGFALAVVAGIALVWRRQHPLVVTGIAVVPPLLFVADTLAALIAVAALAASRRDRYRWTATGLVFVATTLTTAQDARRHPEFSFLQSMFGPENATERIDISPVAIVLIAAALTAIPVGYGLWRGTKRDLARSEQTEQVLLADLARRDERSKIARDMHDILGHRLSVLSLQAGALEVSTAETPAAAQAAQAIRATARQCLDDLRQVIGVLRNGTDPVTSSKADRPPRTQPGLADLPDLITATRQAGLAINVTVLVDHASAAPPALGSAAYRIVQEALTNVLRHAPSTTADVVVRGVPKVGLAIEVTNPLPEPAPHVSDGSGTGLIGIGERVSALGGTVSVGPTDRGTFAVNAWLPWE